MNTGEKLMTGKATSSTSRARRNAASRGSRVEVLSAVASAPRTRTAASSASNRRIFWAASRSASVMAMRSTAAQSL